MSFISSRLSFVTFCIAGSLALYCQPVSGQSWLQQVIPSSERSHDFGVVARAAVTEHRFILKNPLDVPLHIRSVRASCGCTTPIVETEWIKPGETGSILARFNTGTFTGQRGATLTVTFDKPYYAELQLRVRGFIRSDVVLFPGEANFGDVPQGESRVVEISLDYAGRNDWAVVGFEAPVPWVKTQVEEVSRQRGRVKYKLIVGLEETAPSGFHQLQLLLRTNDYNLKSIPLRLTANVEAPVQVSPAILALGRVKPGEPIQQRLVIKSREPVKILAMRSDEAEVDFEPVVEPKKVHLLRITIRPKLSTNQESPEVQGKLLIQTDLQDEPVEVDLKYTLEVEGGKSGVASDDLRKVF